MINEIHAAVLNAADLPSIPGNDHVPSAWRPVPMSAAATAVQRSLLLRPADPAARNWRILEIRRLLPRTDLASWLTRFDPRTGYDVTLLTCDMAKAFRPQVTGSEIAGIEVVGHLTSPAYQLYRWRITTDGDDWEVTSETAGGVAGKFSDTGQVATVQLPGAGGCAVRVPAGSGPAWLRWAARPQITLADTSRELREELRADVAGLAAEPNAKFDPRECEHLRKLATGEGDPLLQVCAATLLLAGRNLVGSSTH